MSRPGKKRRDRSIVAFYRKSGLSQREVAERFGISPPRVSQILGAYGARDPGRNGTLVRERWQRGEFDHVSFEGRGRPSVWPECPLELKDEYRRLMRTFPAAEARRILEGAA